ncbi:hypothetical protein LSAT2_012548 [Lamellibrachia satsuma]|nr:hypothetical protein LSAT2_012548 [Lamellibrachia satsuma]
MRSVEPIAINAQGHTEMDAVQYKMFWHQKSDAELMIGTAARTFLAEKESNGLRQVQIAEFFASVRNYIETLSDGTRESLLVLTSSPVSYVDSECSAATLKTSKGAYHRSLNTDTTQKSLARVSV